MMETTETAKAGHLSNLLYGQPGVGQQCLGQQQTAGAEILNGCDPEVLVEQTPQVAVTDAKSVTQFSQVSLTRPWSIMRAAWWASMSAASVVDQPGACSGRHRRHGRKSAASACAAEPKKRQLSDLGKRTRQIGRQ